MARPDLSKADKAIVDYIESLEERLTEYEESNLAGLYKEINAKLIPLSMAIRTATIDLAGDDKVFDRLMKTLVESRGIGENMNFLELKLGLNQKGDDVKEKNKFKNPLENLAKNGSSNKTG